MYGFKVFVSTLIMFVVLMLTWAMYKSDAKNGKTIACLLLLVHALSLVAIWG